MRDELWNKKIDNADTFQRLMGDLFASDSQIPGFTPSSPTIGSDGSYDAIVHRGSYNNVSGLLSFQAKYTKHSLNDAYPDLRKALKGELEKAKNEKVDYLFFITNAELRVGPNDHVGNLRKLNTGHVKDVLVYHRSKLRDVLLRNPVIMHRYFDTDVYPPIVNYKEYLPTEALLVLDHGTVGRRDSIMELRDFLINEGENIALLHTAPGGGKSHFLIEFAKDIESILEHEVLFVRPNLGQLNQSLQDTIIPERKYLLILDNMDVNLTESFTKELLAFAKNKLGPKILFTCRTENKDIVLEELGRQRLDSNIKLLSLPNLSTEDLAQIFQNISGKVLKHPEITIPAFGSNPLKIVRYAQMTAGNTTPEELRTDMIKSVEKPDTIKATGLDRKKYKLLLREIGLITPFRVEQTEIVSALAEGVSVEVSTITKIIEVLLDHQILRKVGDSIRFQSDVEGNVYVASMFDVEENGIQAVKDAVNYWIPKAPENTARNLFAASRESQTSSISEAICLLLEETGIEGVSLQTALPYLCMLAPQVTIKILSKAIQEDKDLDRDFYGPIIVNIIGSHGADESLLRLIREISEKNISGMYNNYDIKSLIRDTVSPLETKNMDTAIVSLQILDQWIEDGMSDNTASIVLFGVSESLGGSHDYHDSHANKITFGRRGLLYSQKLDEYRDLAMSMYQKLLSHPKLSVRQKTIEAFDSIGSKPYTMEGSFGARMISDRKKALGWIKEMITNEKSVAVVATTEDILLRLWSSNNSSYPDAILLADTAESILNKIEHTPDLLVHKLFSSHDLLVLDFPEMKKQTKDKDRWHWIVYNIHGRYSLEPKTLEKIVSSLTKKYSTPKDLTTLLSRIDSSPYTEKAGHIPLIEEWFKQKPDIVTSVWESNLREKVPEYFYLGFETVMAKKDENYALREGKSISKKKDITHHDIQRLQNLIQEANLKPSAFAVWYLDIAKAYIPPEIMGTIFHGLYFVFKDRKNPEFLRNIIIALIQSQESLTDHAIKYLDFILHMSKDKELLTESDIDLIKPFVEEELVDKKTLGWQTMQLVEMFYPSLEELLEYIEKRLTNKELRHVNVIPYDGFKSMQQLIQNENDFHLVIEKTSEWRKNELISSIDLEHLLNHVSGFQDYLTNYITEKIQLKSFSEDFESFLFLLRALPFQKDLITFYIHFLEKADEIGQFEKAESVFWANVSSGSWSRTIGQDAPVFVSRLENLSLMLKKSENVKIKSVVRELIKQTEKQLQDDRNEDEELLNPKM